MKGAQLASIEVTAGTVKFVIKGTLSDPLVKVQTAGDGLLRCDFTQGGNIAPVTLTRTGPPQLEPPRVSTRVSPEAVGVWQGNMVRAGNPIGVRIALANADPGPANVRFDVKGRRERDLAVTFVMQGEDWTIIESDEPGIVFEERLKNDVRQIAGTIRQGPFEAELILTRPSNPGEAK